MFRAFPWLFGFGFLLLGPAAAGASGTGGTAVSSDAPQFASGGSVAGSLVWVIVALLVVIGLIVLVIKFLSSRSRSWGVNRTLRSLGGVTLGQNKSLQVVEVAGRLYVVGVGDEISLLDKIEDPETVASIIAMMNDQTAKAWNPQTVTELWNKLKNRGNAESDSTEAWHAGDFQDMLKDKLKRQSDHKSQVESLLGESKHRDRLGE